MRTMIFVAGLLGLAAFALASFDEPKKTDEAEPTNDVHAFMQLKLDHSKEVLSGLVLEDFDKLIKHSEALSLLSEETSFQVLQTEDYLQQSIEFRRAADALTNAARKKNLDGAALAYVDMTMKCVNCHKYVRDVRMARVEPNKKSTRPARSK